MNSDPAFVNVKANNQEFAAVVLVSKIILKGLRPISKKFKDTYMQSQTWACRKIIQKGSGHLGQREASLLNKPDDLLGFQLNKKQPFSQIYTAHIDIAYND